MNEFSRSNTTAPAPVDRHAVAGWRRCLEIETEGQGCLRRVPDAADPPDVAAYNEACRQLAAEARAAAEAEA